MTVVCSGKRDGVKAAGGRKVGTVGDEVEAHYVWEDELEKLHRMVGAFALMTSGKMVVVLMTLLEVKVQEKSIWYGGSFHMLLDVKKTPSGEAWCLSVKDLLSGKLSKFHVKDSNNKRVGDWKSCHLLASVDESHVWLFVVLMQCKKSPEGDGFESYY